MAEDVIPAGAGNHAEPPARTTNRRRLFDERLEAASHPRQVLRALAGYITGMFGRHDLAGAKEIAMNLAAATDDERRRHCERSDQPGT